MKQKLRKIFKYMIQPKVFIFLIALLNFLWFFSKSRAVVEFGSTSISLCLYCNWYWDWSLFNLPSLSLFATAFLLLNRRQFSIPAFLISLYEIIQGFLWLSEGRGFITGFKERVDFIRQQEFTEFLTFLDAQYILAVIICLTSLIYFLSNLKREKLTPNNFS